jgi:SpoVK/Ycf46/Vps4 family AAA+-type ATPase
LPQGPENPQSIAASPLIEKIQAIRTLPEWYPQWANDLAEQYFSGTTCLFLIHGNVHDLIYCPVDGRDDYCRLPDFLATSIFGSWDIVLGHDLGRGLRAMAGTDQKRLHAMMQFLSQRLGKPASWPKSADDILATLDLLAERTLLESDASNRKSLSFIFKYAEYLLPAGETSTVTDRSASRLVRFQEWAQNPYIKRVNIAFCLIAEKLSEVSDRLIRNPHVATIEVPLPDENTRRRFLTWAGHSQDLSSHVEFSQEGLASLSSGLTLTSVHQLLSQARQSGETVGPRRFRRLKKRVIERQCQGLIEFVEPSHNLDLVVGHRAAKRRLREDAKFLSSARLSAAPMGYLLCGPVGTGKTFLAECYAGSIGVPCVELKNFRSKYVGETEGNLERVLSVLRSLGPVVVIIDEADAALGTRHMEGDSGTSSRVFSMIASQMGDTHYRGKIVWMLLTSRPDLLPIDLKRQGRAEVHIPLFYPQDPEEIVEMFLVMGKKNGVALTRDYLPALKPMPPLSGADIESIVLAAQRQMLSSGRSKLQKDDVTKAIHQFIPSAQGLEKEMQEIAAVLECTELDFLPEHWKKTVTGPDGRSKLQNRLASFRTLFGH